MRVGFDRFFDLMMGTAPIIPLNKPVGLFTEQRFRKQEVPWQGVATAHLCRSGLTLSLLHEPHAAIAPP